MVILTSSRDIRLSICYHDFRHVSQKHMKAFVVLLAGFISAFVLAPPTTKLPPADLVFKNGNVYTVNDRKPTAEAVAVTGDRIVFVGSNVEAQKYVGKNTRVIDLAGKTMLPGLTDAHHHLSGVGFREMTLNLEGINEPRRVSRES